MSLPIPRLSFAEVQWPLGSRFDMVMCVVERRFQRNCQIAFREIREAGSVLPARAILLPEEGTLDEPNAASVYVLTKKVGLEVALIRGRTASLHRRQLEIIGCPNEPIEILISIAASLRERVSRSPRPGLRLR
jgi:hypothetical protein